MSEKEKSVIEQTRPITTESCDEKFIELETWAKWKKSPKKLAGDMYDYRRIEGRLFAVTRSGLVVEHTSKGDEVHIQIENLPRAVQSKLKETISEERQTSLQWYPTIDGLRFLITNVGEFDIKKTYTIQFDNQDHKRIAIVTDNDGHQVRDYPDDIKQKVNFLTSARFCTYPQQQEELTTNESELIERMSIPPVIGKSVSYNINFESAKKKNDAQQELYSSMGWDNKKTAVEIFAGASEFKKPFSNDPPYKILKKPIMIRNKKLILECQFRDLKQSPHIKDTITIRVRDADDKRFYQPRMHLLFNNEGSLKQIEHNSDPFNALGPILYAIGAKSIAAKLKASPKNVQRYYNARKQTPKLYDNLTDVYNLKSVERKKIKVVGVDECTIADKQTPIGTHSLSTCAACAAINPEDGRKYMLHYNGMEHPIESELKKEYSDTNKLKYFIFTGAGNENNAIELFTILTEEMHVDSIQITIVPARKDFEREDVIIDNREDEVRIFRATETGDSKDAFDAFGGQRVNSR